MEKDGFLRLNNMLFVSNQKIGVDYTRDKLFAYKIYYLRADNGMIHLIGKQVEPSVSSEISEILHERRGEVYNKLISEAFKDCKAEGENPQN